MSEMTRGKEARKRIPPPVRRHRELEGPLHEDNKETKAPIFCHYGKQALNAVGQAAAKGHDCVVRLISRKKQDAEPDVLLTHTHLPPTPQAVHPEDGLRARIQEDVLRTAEAEAEFQRRLAQKEEEINRIYNQLTEDTIALHYGEWRKKMREEDFWAAKPPPDVCEAEAPPAPAPPAAAPAPTLPPKITKAPGRQRLLGRRPLFQTTGLDIMTHATLWTTPIMLMDDWGLGSGVVARYEGQMPHLPQPGGTVTVGPRGRWLGDDFLTANDIMTLNFPRVEFLPAPTFGLGNVQFGLAGGLPPYADGVHRGTPVDDAYRQPTSEQLPEVETFEPSDVLCIACLTRRRNIFFHECTHICYCDSCWDRDRGLRMASRCPLCRAETDGTKVRWG